MKTQFKVSAEKSAKLGIELHNLFVTNVSYPEESALISLQNILEENEVLNLNEKPFEVDIDSFILFGITVFESQLSLGIRGTQSILTILHHETDLSSPDWLNKLED